MATEVTHTIRSSGGDYTSLSAWESGEQRDLTAMQKANTSNHSGTFTSGETLSFSPSGATGVMIETDNSSYMRYELSSGTPSVDDTISGDDSGASCDIDTFAYQDGEIEIAECYNDWPDGLEDAPVIGGWTTDDIRYIKIYTPESERHNGTAGTGFWLKGQANSWRGSLVINDPYALVEGLEITSALSNTYQCINIDVGSHTGWVKVSYCLLHDATVNSPFGIKTVNVGALYVWNNIIYNIDNGSEGDAIYANSDKCNVAYIYNNTISDCYRYGITTYGSAIHAKNNLVQNCGSSCFSGSFNSASDYNASDDSSSTGGTHDRTNQSFTFVDEANDDFHLASNDGGAKDYGTDLSSDPNLAFSDDIDGETRSGTWDIGADEYVAAGGLIKIMDETVSISETLIRRLYANRFIGETVAITETMPRRGYSNRLIDETIAISEGILRRLRSNRIINETISVAEALSRRAFSNRVINETISITEAVLRRLRVVRIINEALSVSESLMRRLRSVRITDETVSIAESSVRSCVSTVVKIMSETVSVTETLVRRLYSKRIMDETISISEGTLRRLRSVRAMAENISISEVLNRRGFLTKIINETVSITETFVRSCIAGIVKIMNETVSVTESLMRKCVSSRVMQEVLNILEALDRRCRMSRMMTETLSIAEAVGRRCRMTKVLNEAVSIVEAMVRSCFATLVKIMSETVSIEESLTKVMTLIEVVVGKMSFRARRASASFKKFMAKIGFSKRGG